MTLSLILPVEEIRRKSQDIELGKLILSGLLLIPYVIGWLAARIYLIARWILFKAYRGLLLAIAGAQLGWEKGLTHSGDPE